MLLKKIIIDNIKSHKHFVFEPSPVGLTAISGDNGTGKSTIVDSFAWALFGTRVKGLKNKDYIRDNVNPKEEKVQVEVVFELGNREYKITRRILSDTVVECLVYSRPLHTTDWQKETGPSVSHAESYIKTLLGTDEKGFLSSIFVQQKQVDQIIQASAKERSLIIEKLIGISSISEGIKLATEERNALRKAANILQPGSLKDEEIKINNQKELVKQLKKQLVEETKKLKILQDDLIVETNKQQKEQLLQEDKSKLEYQENLLKSNIKIYNENLEQLLSLLETTKAKKGRPVSSQLLQEEYSKKYNELSEKKSKLNNMTREFKELELLHNDVIDKDKFFKDYDNNTNILKETENLLNTNKQKVLEYNLSLDRNIKFLDLLNKGEAICSLCSQQIHNPKEEIKKTNESITQLNSLLKNLKLEIKENENLVNKITNENKELTLLLDKANQQENTLSRFQQLKKEIESENIYIDNLLKELNIINDKLVKAKANEQNKELLDKAKTQAKEVQTQLNSTNKELKIIQDKISSHSALPKKDYNKLLSTVKTQTDAFNKKQLETQSLNHRIELEKEKGRSFYVEYQRCLKANEEYNKLTHQLTVLNETVKHLTEFKNLRVSVSIPKLTDLASEIFSKFTDGKYNKLILTEKFETQIVTDDLITRNSNTLSGGELSAAALSLRLAIALFVGDGEQKLLVLDEVLAPMSEDKSLLILETISSLTKAQVILIAHNRVINSFADKVVTIP